ncbi:HAMP domain-containing histidine kinase [Georgenia sp. 311]|uniref:ATP-binding protein n=1 Tax=Georgenia sp. 311 TaxID=2585134 RepID=UPI00111284E3|nr:ATP-binding protein [Georgenia sp. 311]TNC16505.1 HAMP domain-containing histidine kinase [Georgenia sp. 311]
MRRRAVTMTLVAVTVAVLLLGVPLAVFGGLMIWESERSTLELRTSYVGRAVERRIANGEELDDAMLAPFVGGENNLRARIVVQDDVGRIFTAGDPVEGRVLRAVQVTPSGATVRMEVSAVAVQWMVVRVVALVVVAAVLALGVSVLVARRQARKLAAPLIYLAASAEQIGSGQVRPHLRKSGIEEIDLVAAELTRTADRLAGRLAAERQFAADASHQLRTPLTALSMRLEEIQAIATDEDVAEEARVSLELVERLTGVVEDLLRNSRQAGGGTTEALRLADLFAQQAEEWGPTFASAGRELVLPEHSEIAVLATPGALAQVLSTLLENSLKYGAGTTTVRARASASEHGVVIEVTDEGPGVSDDLAPDIFERNVTSGKGTGRGLALARDLVAADGGRLELAQRQPPVFAIFLSAVPKTFDPAVVLPQGSLVSMGRRRRRW